MLYLHVYYPDKKRSKVIAKISPGSHMYLYRKDTSSPLNENDILQVKSSKDEKGFIIFEFRLGENTHAVELGKALFVEKKRHKHTSMKVENRLPVSLRFRYGDNELGKISGNTVTEIDVRRQGFKPKTEISFLYENGNGYVLTIPTNDYYTDYDLVIGVGEKF